jgi:hypothetical protein
MRVRIQLLALEYWWGREQSDYCLYNPTLAPSDYHLFTYMRSWMGSQHVAELTSRRLL